MKNTSTLVAQIFGAVFLVVGLLGFVNNPIVGMDGLFMTNLYHNLVHLLTGVLFFVFAVKSPNTFMKVFGAVYLLVAVLGLMTIGGAESTNLLGLITVNHADNWLHVVLGVVILGAGFVTEKKV